MKEKLDLKVRIQILDSDDQILVQSVINQNQVNDLRVYTGVSLVDETYLILLDELKNQQTEKQLYERKIRLFTSKPKKKNTSNM